MTQVETSSYIMGLLREQRQHDEENQVRKRKLREHFIICGVMAGYIGGLAVIIRALKGWIE